MRGQADTNHSRKSNALPFFCHPYVVINSPSTKNNYTIMLIIKLELTNRSIKQKPEFQANIPPLRAPVHETKRGPTCVEHIIQHYLLNHYF